MDYELIAFGTAILLLVGSIHWRMHSFNRSMCHHIRQLERALDALEARVNDMEARIP